jgi:hypothetical protein
VEVQVFETDQDNMTLREIAEGTGVAEQTLVALNVGKYPGILPTSKLKIMTTITVKLPKNHGGTLSDAAVTMDAAGATNAKRKWGWGVGDRVEANWASFGVYHGGIIERMERLVTGSSADAGSSSVVYSSVDDGKCMVYDIKYDDGDREASVPFDRIRAPAKVIPGAGRSSGANDDAEFPGWQSVRVRWMASSSLGRSKRPLEVRGMFRATLWHHGLPHDLGLWPDASSASKAYDRAAQRLGSCESRAQSWAGLECYTADTCTK